MAHWIGRLPANAGAHVFDPWSWKVPHAVGCALQPLSPGTIVLEQQPLSPCAAKLLKPMCLEPVLLSKGSRRNEKPVHPSEERPPLIAT